MKISNNVKSMMPLNENYLRSKKSLTEVSELATKSDSEKSNKFFCPIFFWFYAFPRKKKFQEIFCKSLSCFENLRKILSVELNFWNFTEVALLTEKRSRSKIFPQKSLNAQKWGAEKSKSSLDTEIFHFPRTFLNKKAWLHLLKAY